MPHPFACRCALVLSGFLAAVSPASATPYLYVSHALKGSVDVIDVVSGRLHDQWTGGWLPGRATLNHQHTRLYVFNSFEDSHFLSIFDTRTSALLHTVPLPGLPLAIAIPDDDATVYVGLVGQAASDIGVIQVVNAQAGTVVGAHDVERGRFMTVSADGGTLYLQDDNVCKVVALATDSFLPLASQTTYCGGADGIIRSPDGTRIYVNSLGGSLLAYDATTLDLLFSVPLLSTGGDLGSPLAISNDGTELVIGSVGDGTVAFIDTAHGLFEDTTVTCGSATGLAYAPDQRHIYVMCDSNVPPRISILDAHSHAVVGEITPEDYPPSFSDFVGAPPVPLYVANRSSGTTGSLDTLTNAAGSGATVGNSPAGIVESPDSRMLYVSNDGDATVAVVSTQSQSVLATIPVGHHPSGVALSPDGRRLYVSNTADDTFSIIDTASRLVIGTIALDANSGPKALVASADGGKLYIALSNWVFIAVYDTATGTLLPPIYCPQGVSDIVVSADGIAAYASGSFSGDVYKIDVATDTVVATWNVANNSSIFATPLALSPDGGRLYFGIPDNDLTMPSEAALGTMDTGTGRLLAWTPLAGTPSSLVVEAEGRHVYAAVPTADAVERVDTTINQVVHVIGGFHSPSAIALPVEALTNLMFQDGFEGAQ